MTVSVNGKGSDVSVLPKGKNLLIDATYNPLSIIESYGPEKPEPRPRHCYE